MNAQRDRRVLLGLAVLVACGGGQDSTDPVSSPVHRVDLASAAFPENGLPDPCELLEVAGAEVLLGRPVGEPHRLNQRCFVRTTRGGDGPRGGVDLEVVTREQPQPGNLDEYWEERGTVAHLLGVKREELVQLPGLGDYALWFPYGEDGMQLTSYWAGKYACLVNVRGIPRDRALQWARELTEELTHHVR